MKYVLWACAAAAVLTDAAPAEDLPKLSDFLSSCYRDNGACQQKIKNYVEAAKTQHIICLPQDVSVREAASETLSWLRKDENTTSLVQQPFDEGLYAATAKLYPCKTEEPPAPPVPPPADDPAGAPS
jgi:hypothetical protein